jgi:hypothetical protein
VTKFVKLGVVTLSVVSVVACSDTTGPDSLVNSLTPDNSLTLDVAMIAANATIDELGDDLLGDLGFLFGANAPAAPGAVDSRKRDRTRTATYFDADGNEQADRDPLTTASIHVVIASTHEFSRASWTATGSRIRDLMITGLEGEETSRTVNGTGSSSVARSRHTDKNGTRTYDMSSTSVIENVVHPVPRTDDTWPLSGTITRHVTVNIVNGKNGDVTKSRTVVITFNGTNLAAMTVDDETFEIDLSTRKGRHPFRKTGKHKKK